MLKLNNRGWGLQVMLACVLVLMIALVIISVLANKVFKNMLEPIDGSSTSNIYKTFESQVLEASKKYQSTYYSNIEQGDEIVVTVEKLKEKNLLTTNDDTSICTGHTIIKNDSKITYHTYIKCGSKYMTAGYQNNV